MATVLITQCLQRDFVDPIGPHDPLPNLLHVGHAESTRLLGTDPSAGPLAQLVDWARRLPPGEIDLIHVRDWHDPDDPAQRDHLAQFGAHCIRGTSGARLVLGMDEHAAPNERIVDSLNLNDLEGTNLAAQLDEIPPVRCRWEAASGSSGGVDGGQGELSPVRPEDASRY